MVRFSTEKKKCGHYPFGFPKRKTKNNKKQTRFPKNKKGEKTKKKNSVCKVFFYYYNHMHAFLLLFIIYVLPKFILVLWLSIRLLQSLTLKFIQLRLLLIFVIWYD